MRKKKRNYKKMMGIAVLFALLGSGRMAYAKENDLSLEEPKIKIECDARWSDMKRFTGELEIRIKGLKAWTEGQKINEKSLEFIAKEELQAEQEGVFEEENLPDWSDGVTYLFEEEELSEAGEEFPDQDEFLDEEEEIPMDEEEEEDSPNEEEFLPDNSENPEEPAKYMVKIHLSEYFGSEEMLSYYIKESDLEKEEMMLSVPLTLLTQYHRTGNIAFPICREGGNGIELMQLKGEEENCLARSDTPFLPALKNDFEVEIQSQSREFKAGQRAEYTVILKNTGDFALENLSLTGTLSCPRLVFEWESAEGLERSGNAATLAYLEAGETREFMAGTLLGEGQESDLTAEITAVYEMEDGNQMERRADLTNKMIPLQVSYSVKKTADRKEASPGEVITYQICIQNTGERTLHSVVSTERFVNAEVAVHFLEKDGVTLNENKTKALIPVIKPAESFLLEAQATVPDEVGNGELINEVIVKSEETQEESVSARSQVRVTRAISGNETYVQQEEQPETRIMTMPSDDVKTGDLSRPEVYLRLLGFAAVFMILWIGILVYEHRKRKS